MKPDNIQLDILTERPGVKNDTVSELDTVIEIQSKQLTDKIENAKALNLCVVIDRSGSMSGDKLEAAKKSCIDIHKRLSDQDLFTVVIFDHEAEVIVNPQVPKSEVIEKITAITSRGATNLSLGWYLGLLELQTYMTENHNNRLFLLSDGEANQGETKKATLAQEASKSRELGITTSTIGIGDDFQEDILEAIASESGGRFWYIQESGIEDIINEEFKGALSVTVDRPRVELKLPDGVTVSKELNSLSKNSGKYRISRPLKGKDLFNFAIRLEVAPDKIKGDNFALEATIYNGEESILTTQKSISLQSPQEYVVSESNTIVRSVVQQYHATITDEKVVEQMSEGSLNLMKNMLIEEIGGMRKVKDALQEERAKKEAVERNKVELRYFASELLDKENSLLLAEIFEEFAETREAHHFIMRWKKATYHERHRKKRRTNIRLRFDDDLQVDLLKDAINLVDILTDKYPDKRSKLLMGMEKLREQLEKYQREQMD